MTNKEKAMEIIIKKSNTKQVLYDINDNDIPSLDVALREDLMQMAEWKDDRIQHVIAWATDSLIATLSHCGLFTDESIAKCAEEFKNDLIKEATKGE